jgi:hypothetical protein
MSSIGPQIPAHLLAPSQGNDSDEEEGPNPPPSANVGPQIPAHLVQQTEEDSDEDDYAPALPPDLVAARTSVTVAPPLPTKVLGPTFPGRHSARDDDSDDDDVGPRPLPPGASSAAETDGVKQFLELEESRRKRLEVRSMHFSRVTVMKF